MDNLNFSSLKLPKAIPADLNWVEFQNLPLNKRLKYFNRTQDSEKIKGTVPFDTLFAQQFGRIELDRIYNLTNSIRKLSKEKSGKDWLADLLKNYRAMHYFVQPSTRTFLSFSSACAIFGMTVTDVRSVDTSSEVKGESFEDTIRTFSSYFDLIVMRHAEVGSSEKAAFFLNQSGRPVPIINAGSGKDQHPTQALLDIYTLRRSFEKKGGLKEKVIMMVGDLRRGRTVRSLCYLLSNFEKIKIIFSSPDYFRMEDDIKEFLKRENLEFEETEEFETRFKDVDAIYMTRLQDEYQEKGSIVPQYDSEHYRLTVERIKYLKLDTIVMHPLPRREEISPSFDHDPRAIYWRQMRNGMWTRSALIAYMFGLEEAILRKVKQNQ